MKHKNNYRMLIIILVLLLIVLGILFFNNEETIVEKKEPEIKLLDNYSRFFTINSCVYKYITFISSHKTDDLINVLDDNYSEKHNITKDNVYKYTGELYGNYSFKSKKIYYQEESNKFIKYYVYGYLMKENIDGISNKQDYYLIVYLDLDKQIFSVAPYNGDVFKEVK